MTSRVTLLLALAAFVSSHPLENAENRVRRQIPVSVTMERDSLGGSVVGVTGSQPVWKNPDNQAQLNMDGHYSQTFNRPGGISNGPPTFGGGATYSSPKIGGALDASHTPGFGTGVSAQGSGLLWQRNHGNTRLDAGVQYNQHFGGAARTPPNFGGSLKFIHKF